MARRTWLGRCTPALQADPWEAEIPAISSRTRRLSFFVPGKVTFTIPGRRSSENPFTTAVGTAPWIPRRSDSASSLIRK